MNLEGFKKNKRGVVRRGKNSVYCFLNIAITIIMIDA